MKRLKAILKRPRRRARPQTAARVLIGALVLANIVAALIAFKPWAASVEDMERRAGELRGQIRATEQQIERLRRNVTKVEAARADGDRFLQEHIMSMRTVSSTLVDELAQVATKAGIKQKGSAFSFEAVEGAETLTRAVVTADYEGTYSDLMHFVNLLDRSPRFLIIESLGAAPQQNGMLLNVSLKLNAFVREDGAASGGRPGL